MNDLNISEVRFRMSAESDEGLIAWASCVLNNAISLNNIAVRKSREGIIYIAFPAKKSGRGNKYFYFRPINSACKAVFDEAIVGAFKKLGAVTPLDVSF